MNLKFGVLILSLAFLAASCNSSLSSPGSVYNEGEITLAGKKVDVDIAATSAEREVGLGNRAPLTENQGMLFLFDTSDYHTFWMKDMRFAIDIIWLQDDTVVYIEKNARPQPSQEALKLFKPTQKANKVLEVRSGWANQNNLKIGDRISPLLNAIDD